MASLARAGAFARNYVTTMRPHLLFVSAITGLAGLSLSPGVGAVSLALLSGAFFLSYGFGQALTDCSQLDTDALSAPYRPLVRGALGVRQVAVVSSIGLSAIGAALVWHNLWNLALVLLAIAGLATYTRFKRRWWAGPPYNAAIVGLLLLTGYLAGVGEAAGPGPGRMPHPLPSTTPAFWATVSLAFFAYANFVLAGYFKDIAADRAAGYRTLPVVFGRRLASRVSDGLAALASLSALIAVASAHAASSPGGVYAVAAVGVSAIAVGAGIGASVLGQVRLHRVTRDEDAHRAIEPTVHAYLLLLTGVAVLHQPAWALPLAGHYVVFTLAMRARPDRAQI